MKIHMLVEHPGAERRSAVLVVEDEVLIRVPAALHLRDRGYTVVEAVDADEALRVLKSNISIDLVFSDINLPGRMDGVGLVHLVLRDFPHMKVLITSNVSPRLADVAFLEKPYTLARLETLVGELLRP